MYPDELEYGKWYRSKEKTGGTHLFTSFMINKKWTMEEEFNNHMLTFQQVTVSSNNFNKLHFYIPGWIVSHWSSFQSGKGGRQTRTPENGTFLFRPRTVAGRNTPVSPLFHSRVNHQPPPEKIQDRHSHGGAPPYLYIALSFFLSSTSTQFCWKQWTHFNIYFISISNILMAQINVLPSYHYLT